MTSGESTSVTTLLEEAGTRSGLTDWGDRSFVAALTLLVESCRETAALNATGVQVLRKAAVRHLRNRLSLGAFVAAHPETADEEIGAPIFITGLPRTGTTMLHNLMALDPAHRVLRFWEALRPVPPELEPEPGSTVSRDELVRQAQQWLERLYQLSPGFRVIHPGRAEGPEECDALLQNSFVSQHFDDMFRAESYSRWLNTAVLDREYDYYRLQLRVLSKARDRGLVWVLKSPSHLGNLGALLGTFPGALVVQCHRDPLEAIPSYASLVQAVREPYTDSFDLAAAGEHALRRCAIAVERAREARRSAGEDRFVDVSYAHLVRDSISCVRAVYDRTGRPLGEDEETSMRRWLAENPQHAGGAHRYSLDKFQLDPGEVTAAFAGYTRDYADQIG